MAPLMIDDLTRLQSLLIRIAERLRSEPRQLLFIDVEGVKLGRNGTITIIQLLMPPDPTVYLIDVYVLGAQAFNFTIESSLSLRSLLESQVTFKVFFDIRHDSDALYGLFRVSVAGIVDIQILEFANREIPYKRLSGLAACIEKDLPSVPGWQETKEEGRRLFKRECGGRYEVFLERPLLPEILRYCEQDVLLLPALLASYTTKLRRHRLRAIRIQSIVKKRISISQAAGFDGDAKGMADGPRLKPIKKFVNYPVTPDIQLLCSPDVSRLCRLDAALSDDLLKQFGDLRFEAKEESRESKAVLTTVVKTPQEWGIEEGISSP